MLVPKYWAEGRVQHRQKGKQVTIRRYGWSDASQADAQANADARASDALARVLAGEKLHRRDHKVAYNGAEGLPIREEILSTHGEAVVTRNSYGAHCLNTPNVLFADVDLPQPKSWKGAGTLVVAIVFFALAYRWLRDSGACCERPELRVLLLFCLSAVAIFVAAFLVDRVTKIIRKGERARLSKEEEAALGRVREFSASHPDWGLRVYRTPAGFRVLASHATFDPGQIEVAECFSQLKVDSVYRRMCLNQRCFRARLTAKPWRAGIPAHMRPRPGVWPIKAEQAPIRAAWVAEYERVAGGFAACRFIETLGNGVVHPDVRGVIELHDARSRAISELPLA